ncbi:hypothetical protein MCETHM1_00971 [Flavobacteriaceae bacterium]|jgi:hypothetical protein
MFLNYVKRFSLLRTLKKQLFNVKKESLILPITSVGLIVDERRFFETNALKNEIISNGIAENNIKIISYKEVVKNKVTSEIPFFGWKDLNFKNEFTKQSINDFLSKEYDLLINYYNEEDTLLLFLSQKVEAKFKVGFSAVDKRLNHLLINIELENYKGFTHELFRYLKILNKI